MKYFELKCKAYLKKDIDFKNSFETIGRFISFSIMRDEKTKELHQKKGYKYYTFGSFLPIEKDGIYKKDNIYEFNIHTPSEILAFSLEKTLRENINNPNLQILQVFTKEIKQYFITELYTATPTIVTVENGKFYWSISKDGDILKLQRLLHENLEKKYKSFYKEELKIEQNFIQLIEIKNHKPQTIQIHKNNKIVKFYGNKFRLVPHEDKVSQKLAFMALSCGLGEKNSFGGGFCVGRMRW